VVVQPPTPSPAQAPIPEVQEAASPKPAAPEVIDIPPEVEIPHDGTVISCFQDPVCSAEQARIQTKHVDEMKAARNNGEMDESQNLHDWCRHLVRSKVPLPEACRSLGG
jgi:hypothetical protein